MVGKLSTELQIGSEAVSTQSSFGATCLRIKFIIDLMITGWSCGLRID